MGIKQVKIAVGEVTLGMFISSLDRPWAQTPFPIQGLMVRSHKEVKALRAYCDYVYIDVTKGCAPKSNAVAVPAPLSSSKQKSVVADSRAAKKTLSQYFDIAPIVVRRDVYHESVPVSVESGKAEEALINLRGSFTLAVKQIAKSKAFDYENLMGNVKQMVDSVIRCPDAFTWLLRLRLKDQHSHDHSLRSALWAVQFARYIGMPKADMNILCLGTLLKDVGKLKIPNDLLRKRHRTAAEDKECQKFVKYGVEMLRASKKVEPRVISVVRYHCERHDGSGFPEGLVAGKIPLLARIAGVATTYDALSNPRESAEPVAPSRAVSLLYNMRGKKFQEDLVVQFIQSVGLYPTGTLVELTTGDVGVVMEQDPKSRLTPRVAVISRGAVNDDFILIDLKYELAARKTLQKAGRDGVRSAAKLAIARDLEGSGYDIDLKKVSGLIMECSESVVSSTVAAKIRKSAQEGGGILKGLRNRFRHQ